MHAVKRNWGSTAPMWCILYRVSMYTYWDDTDNFYRHYNEVNLYILYCLLLHHDLYARVKWFIVFLLMEHNLCISNKCICHIYLIIFFVWRLSVSLIHTQSYIKYEFNITVLPVHHCLKTCTLSSSAKRSFDTLITVWKCSNNYGRTWPGTVLGSHCNISL